MDEFQQIRAGAVLKGAAEVGGVHAKAGRNCANAELRIGIVLLHILGDGTNAILGRVCSGASLGFPEEAEDRVSGLLAGRNGFGRYGICWQLVPGIAGQRDQGIQKDDQLRRGVPDLTAGCGNTVLQHIVEGFFRLCVVVFQNAAVEQAQTIVEIGAALLLHIRNAFCAPPKPGIVQLLNGPGKGFIELLIAVTHDRCSGNKSQRQKVFCTGKGLLGNCLKVGLSFAGKTGSALTDPGITRLRKRVSGPSARTDRSWYLFLRNVSVPA